MLMVDQKIDVHSNIVNLSDVDFLHRVKKASLVDVLLKWMHTYLQGLVF